MKRNKRFLILTLESLVLIFVVCVFFFYCHKKSPLPKYTYKDYEIIITDNEYCRMSHTGVIELEIHQIKDGMDKLLETSKDVIYDGSNMIKDDKYEIRLRGNKYYYANEAYEERHKEGIQYIQIYYINQDLYGTMDGMSLEVKESQSKERIIKIDMEPKIEEDGQTYTYLNQKAFVTKSGIMLDTSAVPEMYDSVSMKSGLMEVCWNDRSADLAIDPAAYTENYREKNIIKAKASWTRSKARYYYALELNDWKNIDEIRIGSTVFEKEGVPATRCLDKQRHRTDQTDDDWQILF